MSIETPPPPVPRSLAASRAGSILTGLVVLFLVVDGAGKVLEIAPVMDTTGPLEIPARVIPGLGVVLIVCTLLYAIPPTATLGAILLTGYLGGACWTHVRLGGPIFPMAFSPMLGALAWLGLFLREPRLRAILPWRSGKA